MIGKDVTAIPIPDLAAAIEFGAHEEKIEECIRSALPKDLESFDAVILACTHYPLVLSAFKRLVPSKVLLFDPALAVAERVERAFWPREAGEGRMSFLISRESPEFRALVGRFFPHNASAVKVLE
jgi:glutamate racemase